MEGDLQMSPQLGYPMYNTDAKYVSGLSTILVATIQETKDRISQIEYIFCSQLFPNFQAKSRSMQKFHSEAMQAAEETWKEKEKGMLLQIGNLQLEMQQTLEENKSLKFENANLDKIVGTSSVCLSQLQEELKQKNKEVAEGMDLQQNLLKLLEPKASVVFGNDQVVNGLEQKSNLRLEGRRSLVSEAEGFGWEHMNKSEDVEGGFELKEKILQLVQSKVSLVVHKDKQLKEHEEKISKLLANIRSLENKVDELQGELREKTEQHRGKILEEDFAKKFQSQSSEMMVIKQMLNDGEKEKRLIADKMESLTNNVDGLQKELRMKIEEVEEGRKIQEQLHQQIDFNGLEMSKVGQELEELQKEKKVHLVKVKCLEEKVEKLQELLRERSNETTEGMELHAELLKEIEAKNCDLQAEKKKRKEMIDSYKRLKSQYNYLLAKSGLTPDLLPGNSHNQYPSNSPGAQVKVPNSSIAACKWTNQNEKQETSDDRGFGFLRKSSSDSPSSSSSPVAANCRTQIKTSPLAGSKRPVSHWRDTRSHQKRGGLDPHDDFLDTPLENVRANFKKAMKQEVHDIADPVPKDMNLDSSDDETQDLNVNSGPKNPETTSPRPRIRDFKYVEPVRKKAERQKLKGIECKQCKKFYDAVLPGSGGKDSNGSKHNLRCEHHEGVSRHRYRYAPPSTPEGFWNIGFESEM